MIGGSLSAGELLASEIIILRLHQQEEFSEEWHQLQQDQPIDRKSRLLPLNPFLDKQGIIRAGGRLAQAPLSFSQRFPIVLSTNHIITELIIRDCHY